MISALQAYHPLIIEGMGGYDARDPALVCQQIIKDLQQAWRRRPPKKPVLLVTQGDPHEDRGIAAITRGVADGLKIPRGLIFLDRQIADYHAANADRYKVIVEIAYSQMADRLEAAQAGCLEALSQQVRARIAAKNGERKQHNKPALPAYYFNFAMLQETTKAACKQLCGGITIAHTSREINQFSVTSFYQVGLALGLIDAADMVPFGG